MVSKFVNSSIKNSILFEMENGRTEKEVLTTYDFQNVIIMELNFDTIKHIIETNLNIDFKGVFNFFDPDDRVNGLSIWTSDTSGNHIVVEEVYINFESEELKNKFMEFSKEFPYLKIEDTSPNEKYFEDGYEITINIDLLLASNYCHKKYTKVFVN